MTWSQKILDYHFNLKTDIPLPKGIEWLYPYTESMTQSCMRAFYKKYYSDTRPRRLILGINPGRFGAGTTGVPFTDPVRMTDVCGISNDFPRRQELSSVFVYDVITAYGGCSAFCKDFYINSICPLGFLQNGKNFNYYDSVDLTKALEPLIMQHLKAQIKFGLNTDKVICLGQGKNLQYLEQLNTKHKLFDEIIPLPHPRWVMQYRLKYKEEYIGRYMDALDAVMSRRKS